MQLLEVTEMLTSPNVEAHRKIILEVLGSEFNINAGGAHLEIRHSTSTTPLHIYPDSRQVHCYSEGTKSWAMKLATKLEDKFHNSYTVYRHISQD